jgi:hypothetical protein
MSQCAAFESPLKIPHILKSGSLVLVVAAIVSSVEVDVEGVRTGTEDGVVLGVLVTVRLLFLHNRFQSWEAE